MLNLTIVENYKECCWVSNRHRIDTQDTLFGGLQGIERYIEVGPADILGGLARRTLAAKYASADRAWGIKRNILSYNKDANDVYYHYPDVEEPSSHQASNTKPNTPLAVPPAAMQAPTPAEAPPLPAVSVAQSASAIVELEDADPAATDVVRAVVAQKLKKGFEEISPGRSIKDLSGGKCRILIPCAN